jgi:DNA-binding CsgD family transcriptional regulator
VTRTRFEAWREQRRVVVGDSYLTPREYQVISMYIDGLRQAEMPNKLACSVKTINAHIRVARERVGARTLNELIAMVAASDALRGRGRSSNRVAVTGTNGPGTAPSRVL